MREKDTFVGIYLQKKKKEREKQILNA